MPTSPHTPRCWSCGYILTGINSTRCPECGREFDPDDPVTVNRGLPLTWLGRRLIAPLGWGLGTLSMLAALLVAAGTGWPLSFDERFLDWPMLKRGFGPAGATPWWRLYTIGLALALVTALLLLLRGLARAFMLRRYRPPAELCPRRRWPVWLWFGCMLLVIPFLAFGGSRRLGREWVSGKWIPAPLPLFPSAGPPLPPSPPLLIPLNSDQKLHVIARLIQHGDNAFQRRWGCRLLVESYPAHVIPVLRRTLPHERDPDLAATQLHLVALRPPEGVADWIVPFIDDPRPPVAAAAIDALGLHHHPAYRLPETRQFWRPVRAQIDGDPPVFIDHDLHRAAQAVEPGSVRPFRLNHARFPQPLREKIAARLMGNVPAEVREAAARALLPEPPRDYTLRLAEWGVWLAENGDLKTIRAIDSEIPPFVHRTGNPIAEFSDRINPIMMITKPVIHLTASQPLVVDLEVHIRGGRPWVVYPMPDDFEVKVETRYGGPLRSATQPGQNGFGTPTAHWLQPLDNPALKPLDPSGLHTGYPWLAPHHRTDGPISSKLGAVNQIVQLGVRWQSLVVCPTKQTFMTEPAVGDNPSHQWWKRLREVECSWVWSRGESERFLYYDGPTLLKAPLTVAREGDFLQFFEGARQNDNDEVLGEFRTRTTNGGGFRNRPEDRRHGLFVQVADGQPAGQPVLPSSTASAQLHPAGTCRGPNLIQELRKMLLDHNLRAAEADALLDCWHDYFFTRPGQRFILVMSREDYDRFCPLSVTPPPTESARVGLIVYELK